MTDAATGAIPVDETSGKRSLTGPARVVQTLLLGLMPLIGVAFTFNLPDQLGYPPWKEQYSLVLLGFGLAATFLGRKASRRERAREDGRPPVFDIFLAGLAFLLCLRAAYDYPDLMGIGYLGTGTEFWVNLVMAGIGIAMVCEAVRRLTGLVMVILIAVFLVYAVFAGDMPGVLQGITPEPDFLIGYLFLDPNGVVGIALSVVVSTVIAFVLLGNALFRLGGGGLFIDLALSSMGRFRGGPAKASVMASSLFGTVSGSAVANVVTTGIVTIPLMKRGGYEPHRAGAVEAVASTGGQLLPPVMGTAAFIMADFLGLKYAEVALAALLPALFFYFSIFVQIDFHAARAGLRGLEKGERPDALATLARLWPFLVPLVLLVVLLFVYNWEASHAAFLCVLACLVAALLVDRRVLAPRSLWAMMVETGQGLLDIIAICAGAGLIIGVLALTGLSFSIGIALLQASGENLLVLLLIAAATATLFGMGMPTTAVYIMMATLIAPAIKQAGVVEIGAHLFVLYYGCLSMITPPVCLASFTAASLAGAPYMKTGWQSMKTGAVAFIVPFLFIASPALLLQSDTAGDVAAAIVTGMCGCLLIAAAIEGYLFTVLGRIERVVAALAGINLLLPNDGAGMAGAWIAYTDQAGLALGVLLGLWLILSRRAGRRAGEAGSLKRASAKP